MSWNIDWDRAQLCVGSVVIGTSVPSGVIGTGPGRIMLQGIQGEAEKRAAELGLRVVSVEMGIGDGFELTPGEWGAKIRVTCAALTLPSPGGRGNAARETAVARDVRETRRLEDDQVDVVD